MKRIVATACVTVMMLGGVWGQQPAPTKTAAPSKTISAKKKKKAAKKQATVTPSQQVPAQTMPPVPATLMNSAPVAPKVTMAGGLLTIDAPNSTLSDVLNEVRKATGAAVEGASPAERVAVRLGPGDPEQVLAALLRGTPYDYVIVGALGKQDAVTRVLLQTSAHDSGPSSTPVAARQFTPPPPPDNDDNLPDRTVPDNGNLQPNADNQPEQPPQQQPPPDANQPKTPEQLFNELQQMEQQKQPQAQPTK